MTNKQPGLEYPLPDEDVYIRKITQLFIKTLSRYYSSGITRRIFHPKMHGLVKAEFTIAPNLPVHIQQGIFESGVTYPAWIRFSNAKKHPAADKNRDMRGMAIKLFGVNGAKLLENEQNATTQDFLLVTSKTLQTRSVKDFYTSLAALMGGPLKLFLYVITHCGVAYRSLKQISRCSNLLETSFFSTTPSLFGSIPKAVKYAVIPQKRSKTPFPQKPAYNFLKEQLVKDLAEKDFYFDFMIQFQEDPDKMPIEDPTVEWRSPFFKIATIKIPKQTFDSPDQISYGENLSFTPWHSIAEHRPLGGVNRARKVVYEELAAFRHSKNGTLHEEPTRLAFPEQTHTFPKTTSK